MSTASPHDPATGHTVRMSSDRSFGLVFAAFFLLVALAPLVQGGAARPWAAAMSLLFLAVALTRPAVLAPLNRLWFRLGLLLHRIVSPLVFGLVFYGVLTPLGLLMRAAGKYPMRADFLPQNASYWIERRPAGPAPGSMKQQF